MKRDINWTKKIFAAALFVGIPMGVSAQNADNNSVLVPPEIIATNPDVVITPGSNGILFRTPALRIPGIEDIEPARPDIPTHDLEAADRMLRQPDQRPIDQIVPMGGFLTHGDDSSEDWFFIMGPRGPNAVLRLQRSTRNGSVGFECKREDGSMQFVAILPRLNPPSGSDVNVQVSVGPISHPLRMRAEPIPSSNPPVAALTAVGQAASDILAVMSTNRAVPFLLRLRQGPHSAEFNIGDAEKQSLFRQTAIICRGWNLAAQRRANSAGGVASPAVTTPDAR